MTPWRALVFVGDIVADEDRSPDWMARQIAARLKCLPYWDTGRARDDEFRLLVEGLEEGGLHSFDMLQATLDDLYDWGDIDKRLWIDTFDTDPEKVRARNEEHGVKTPETTL